MTKTIKAGIITTALIIAAAMSPLHAGETENLAKDINNWLSKARAAGRLDCDMLKKMWELSCGADLEANEPDEINKMKADISGLTARLASDLTNLEKEYTPLKQKAADLKNSKKSTPELNTLALKMEKTKTNLKTLHDTGAAKGVLHPSVQLAVEYGKRKHADYNGKYSCTIYDQQLTSGRTRPDCVIVGPDACYLYEFKPDNSAAVSKGRSQLNDYRNNITIAKAGQSLPKYQRETMSKYCANGDKMKFKVVDVKTYQMCRQEYRCIDPAQ